MLLPVETKSGPILLGKGSGCSILVGSWFFLTLIGGTGTQFLFVAWFLDVELVLAQIFLVIDQEYWSLPSFWVLQYPECDPTLPPAPRCHRAVASGQKIIPCQHVPQWGIMQHNCSTAAGAVLPCFNGRNAPAFQRFRAYAPARG